MTYPGNPAQEGINAAREETREHIATPESVGNQFGYLCPKCGEGDGLSVVATVLTKLYPDGAEVEGDQEWDQDAGASCKCGWTGKVRDFKEAPNFEAD